MGPVIMASQRALAQEVQDAGEDISAATCSPSTKAADQTPWRTRALLPSLQHLLWETREKQVRDTTLHTNHMAGQEVLSTLVYPDPPTPYTSTDYTCTVNKILQIWTYHLL